MIKAFLFDMDGVLADTEDLSITIGIEYFSSIGIKASRADFEPNLGAGERAFFDRTALSLGALGNSRYSYEDASAFFRARYPELLARLDSAHPGAAEAVRNARRSGIMTSVASSAPAWKVHENIKAIGLCADDFDFIATGEDIRRNKPEKDIYELCLIKLGVDGSEAVVFEDSVSGITSGKRAGCQVVALMTTIDGESAARAGADAVISDLSVLPRFSSADEAESAIFSLSSEEKGEVYGANIIRPGRRRLSDAFTLERVKKAAAAARENAYAPYSGFKVGAAVLSASSGRIYAGCNVENSSYGATICAERNAITTAITAEGVIGIDILVVCSDDDPPAPPCAVCLQVIAEYARPDTHIVLFSVNGQERHYAFSELLPNPFVFPTMRR